MGGGRSDCKKCVFLVSGCLYSVTMLAQVPAGSHWCLFSLVLPSAPAMWWCLKPIAKGLRDLAQFMDPVVPGPTPACPCCYYNYMEPIGDPADMKFTAGWYKKADDGDQWHWWHGDAIHGRPGAFRHRAEPAGPGEIQQEPEPATDPDLIQQALTRT